MKFIIYIFNNIFLFLIKYEFLIKMNKKIFIDKNLIFTIINLYIVLLYNIYLNHEYLFFMYL